MGKGLKDAGKLPQDEIDQIAGRLRLGRMALGYNAAQLCRLVGCKPNTYSQWENGRGAPRLDQARKMRKVLGYTLDWIYDGDRSGLPMKLAMDIAAIEAEGQVPQQSDETHHRKRG